MAARQHSSARFPPQSAVQTKNVIYAALMISGSANITITAETASDTYAYGKTSVSFDYGKYYEVTVKMFPFHTWSSLL